MSSYSPLIYFLLALKASLFSSGGMGNLPLLHDDLVSARGWAGERQIAESIAVGQTAPGPSGLWVLSLGYLVDGLRGSLLTLLAITLPPLLVLVVDRAFRTVEEHPAARGFVRGLSLGVVGTMLFVMWQLLRSTGLDAGSLIIAAGGAGLALIQRLPVIVVILLAAVAGVLLYGGAAPAGR